MKTLAAAVVMTAILGATSTASAQAPAKPEPARLELAHKLVDVSGGRATMESLLNNIYGTMSRGLFKNMPADQQRTAMAVQKVMQDEMLKLVPQMIDISAEAYARNLTETELRDMITWQTSATGRSVQQKMPAIMQDVMAAEMPMIQAMAPKLAERAVDVSCEELKCTPAERQVIADAMQKALKPAS